MALFLLYRTLGPSIFAGIIIMVLSVPLNGYLATKMRAIQKDQMTFKDQRSKLMDEVLNGIKVIKLYAWEKSFIKKVSPSSFFLSFSLPSPLHSLLTSYLFLRSFMLGMI